MSHLALEPCGLCGDRSSDVRIALVRYNEAAVAAGKPLFEEMPRCRDVEACRQRVLTQRQPWPVARPVVMTEQARAAIAEAQRLVRG